MLIAWGNQGYSNDLLKFIFLINNFLLLYFYCPFFLTAYIIFKIVFLFDFMYYLSICWWLSICNLSNRVVLSKYYWKSKKKVELGIHWVFLVTGLSEWTKMHLFPNLQWMEMIEKRSFKYEMGNGFISYTNAKILYLHLHILTFNLWNVWWWFYWICYDIIRYDS